jgi:RHS repeat-associated protein
MQQVVTEQTIDYTYDPLNRLTGANYDDGSSYVYTYDAVGNRLTENAKNETNQYTYDAANPMASVNGQTYTYDANGNLLADGTKTYTYNYANRLTQVVSGTDTYQYKYNGLGDRLQSLLNGTATTYSLDLNNGLTQVLADGTNSYTYGFNRIAQVPLEGAQVSEVQTGYFLGDALGSVRQVVDPQTEILLAQSYSPYGEVISSVGDFETAYSYTSEMTDGTGLVNLRARYYDPGTGRFISKDTWEGIYNQPHSLNKWGYVEGNPVGRRDPSGYYWWGPGDTLFESSINRFQNQNIHVRIQNIWMVNRQKNIHAEFIIPGTYYPVDLLDSISGEIWEIKPIDDSSQAISDVNLRVLGMNSAKGLLHGKTPLASDYNWDFSPLSWFRGVSFPQKITLGTDTTGWYTFYAGQTAPGIILWWKVFNPKPVPLFVPINVPEKMTWSDRNLRESSQNTPGLVPAYELFPYSNSSLPEIMKNSINTHMNLTKESLIFTGLGIFGGSLTWWLGKILSPACGPAVVFCAICL